MSNETLVAVPLFVFMGVTLERARIAEELLETLSGNVWLTTWWPWNFSDAGRHVAGSQYRHCRCDGRNDGPAVTADHVEARLFARCVGRDHLRVRHARPDYSALDHSRHARRCHDHCIPAGAARDGHFFAENGVCWRLVCRCTDSRAAAGRALHALYPRASPS